MSHTNVSPLAKGLLYPKLLKLYFTTFLNFGFVFTTFIGLKFYGTTRSGMLEFYFSAQRPAFSKIVAKVNNGMGNIEATIAWIVFIFLRTAVAVNIITVEVAGISHFSIAAKTQSVTRRMAHHTICSVHLPLYGSGKQGYEEKDYLQNR